MQAPQIKIEEKIEVVDDNIETEQILEEINYDDIKVFNTNQQTAQYINISSDDEENNFDKKSHNNLTSSRINLSHKDLKNISNQEMLTDNAIHVFQNMIKKQNTDVNGLQDPVLGETLNFSVYQSIPFVQVLHDGRLHWVAISTYGCRLGEVCLMDSLFNGRIADHTKRQICAILNCPSEKLKVNVVPVQQQQNSVDCGVFALAYVYYIVSKKRNPSNVFFCTEKMRNHLLQCLSANKFSDFPETNKVLKRSMAKMIPIDVFCSCRMPWKKSEDNLFEKQMAECSNCKGWFHRMCERIPDVVFNYSKQTWLCYHCAKENEQ